MPSPDAYRATKPVLLLSDLGPDGPYPGLLRLGLMQAGARGSVVDLAHDLPTGDPTAARFLLASFLASVPDETVVLVHAGAQRGAGPVALRCRRAGSAGTFLLLGPDDGLLSALVRPGRAPYATDVHAEQAVRLHTPAASPLQGAPRPVRMAPGGARGPDPLVDAAARVAAGAALSEVGAPLAPERLATVSDPRLAHSRDAIVGQVVAVDRFGNLISDVPAEALPARGWRALVTTRRVTARDGGFQAVACGAWVAYLGSFATAEVALAGGSAAARLQLEAGAPFAVEPVC